MNNWWGIKGFKKDDWSVDSYKLPYKWCWLYPFANMNQYWDGLANTVSMGYVKWWCDNLRCLSSFYVGTPGKVKSSRVIRVEFFINYK